MREGRGLDGDGDVDVELNLSWLRKLMGIFRRMGVVQLIAI